MPSTSMARMVPYLWVLILWVPASRRVGFSSRTPPSSSGMPSCHELAPAGQFAHSAGRSPPTKSTLSRALVVQSWSSRSLPAGALQLVESVEFVLEKGDEVDQILHRHRLVVSSHR